MPYRRNMPRSRAGNALALFNTGRSGNNFKKEGSGIRRHNQNFNIASGNTAIDSGEWLSVNGALMRRSFTASEDTEPTPTASNNYATSQVMNGSNIYNFSSTIKIQNE